MSSTEISPVDLAAQAVVDLINSQPFSPRQSEIVAIIEMILNVRPPPSPQASALPNCKELDEEYGPIISTGPG
jgi:hypothetical protein